MPTSSDPIYSAEDQAILMALETTYNDNTTAVAADALRVADISVTPLEGNTEELNVIKGFMGNNPVSRTEAYVKVNFNIPLAGSGTANVPVPHSLARRAAANAEVIGASDVQYAPVGTDFESVVIYYYAGEVLHVVRGVLGKYKLELGAGKSPKEQFEFLGLYSTPEKATIPAGIDFTAFLNPLIANAETIKKVELFDHECPMKELSADLGATPTYQNLAYSEGVSINSRKGSFSITFREPDPSVINFWDLAKKNAQGPLNYQLGDDVANVGHIFKLDIPNVQLATCSRTYINNEAFLQITGNIVPLTKNSDYLITNQ